MAPFDRERVRRRLGPGYRRLRTLWLSLRARTPFRQFRNAQLRRLTPLHGGRQRGEPVVRYYWRTYLAAHGDHVRGHGLEIGDTATLRHYGGERLTAADALDLRPREGVTVVADLSRADHLPADTYDCFVVPFTSHLIYDIEAALYHALRVLKPGGVLLINFPCVDYDFPRGLDMATGRPLFVFWWFTPLQVRNLLRRVGLSDADVDVHVYGNLFARIAYQLNLPVEELTAAERDHADPGHPLLVCARAIKPHGWTATRPEYRDAWVPDTTPDRWNSETGHYPRP
jgi:SAM-dependent methyltransferase